MSIELFHLILVFLALVVLFWILRLARVSIGSMEVLITGRLREMNLITVNRFIPTLESRIDQQSRQMLQDLIKGVVDPPSSIIHSVKNHFQIYKDSFQIVKSNGIQS